MSSPGNAELGEFLRTRRSHMDPRKAGIPESTRRRVPGLRRPELARLASISPDYYTRLEQGRHPTASPGVLDALARALLLSADERAHLYALAQAVDPDPPDDGPAADYAGALERMLAVFGSVPAVLCGAFSDILAANDAAWFCTAPTSAPCPPLSATAFTGCSPHPSLGRCTTSAGSRPPPR